MCPIHTVVQGEFLAQIVARAGFASSKGIWELPENDALREKRVNPNVLLPGDEVFLPDPNPGTRKVATGKTVRFRRVEEELMLRLRLVGLADKPLAGRSCELKAGGASFPLKTDEKGIVEHSVPASVGSAELVLQEEDGSEVRLHVRMDIGHLDPVTEESGQRERLRNLGYFEDPLEGEDPDAALRMAVEEFQCDHKLTVDGKCGPKSQAKLKEVHGC